MGFPPDMGPQAPYRNPPPVPQYFRPSVFYISSISNGPETTITTATNHNYVLGQQITCLIPPTYKEIQLNGMQGFVTSIPSPTEVVVNINSTNFDTFNPSPVYGPTRPQIIAIGDVNTGITANSDGNQNNGTTIPGSFINTSPIKGPWLN